ncbi:type II toxin-antitoxin system VapC family toxin [Anaerolineales bacterium HSG6]|nr:type II toxin-antitoxin system VapC family toxin [Anaerolineales bacterium HSG6]MDM8529661.1 type II toxin-antitoxin system VapC family toxin [Anaerolineales bacterium HSG25]
MKFLLDTHSFLWFVEGDTKLSVTARTLIEERTNQPLLSIASIWEMAIKISIGKLQLTQPIEQHIPYHMQTNDVTLLGIDIAHVVIVATLPYHHRDPFDRLLIAQAIHEQIPIISIDTAFDDYGVHRLW